MKLVLLVLAAYLYGAVPYAYLAMAAIRREDLSRRGTGNIGVTNAFKSGGPTIGIITLAGEISKALVPISLAGNFYPDNLPVTLLLVFCSLLGTCFSIFLKGLGGKGTTAGMWSLLILSPYSCILVMLIWVACLKLSHMNLLIKRVPLFCMPIVIFLVERDIVFASFGLLLGLLFYAAGMKRLDDFVFYGIFRKASGGGKSHRQDQNLS